MGSRKQQQGIEGAAERLRALLAELEEAVQALSETVERDEDQDLDDTRARLGELHGRAVELVTRANALLDEVREVSSRISARVESADRFIADFEEVLGSLETSADALNPDNWEWGEEGEEP